MKRSKRATNSLSDDQMQELIDLVEELFSAGKAYLKIDSLVKTPLHEFMAVERSGLWAPDPVFDELQKAHNGIRGAF